jgi:hypothetical protein
VKKFKKITLAIVAGGNASRNANGEASILNLKRGEKL